MDGGGRTVRIAYICTQGNDRLPAADILHFVCDLLQFFAIEVHQRELSAFPRKRQRHGPAEAAPRAGHHDDFAGQFAVSHFRCLYCDCRGDRHPAGSPDRQAAAMR